jgi:hypothetical protein
LLISRGDCVAVDSEIGAGPWDEANRGFIIWVHLIVGAGFVIRIHIELSFQGEVAICRFVVLVTLFDMAEKRHDMQFCTGIAEEIGHHIVQKGR